MYIILNMSVDCRSTVLEYCGGGGEEDDRTATGRGTVFGALGGRGGVQHTTFGMCRNRLIGE